MESAPEASPTHRFAVMPLIRAVTYARVIRPAPLYEPQFET
jgi:hypothetical protein